MNTSNNSVQVPLPYIGDELIVDLFAGGGGASTGMEQATGRFIDIAINHDAEAIALHEANHPHTKHYIADVFEVDPVSATQGRPVGLLWASPSCTHFSRARGSMPVSKQLRSLAWVVTRWASKVRPRVIIIENVDEMKTWGPVDKNRFPCKQRTGQTYALWVASLKKLGYAIESRSLVASDYGAPTTRKRLFIIARCDGQAIVWPAVTHGDPTAKKAKAANLRAWEPVSKCIDWSLPSTSIFDRKKPLADATLRRIAKGIQRYVIDAEQPYIVGGSGDAMVIPTLVQTGYGERVGQAARVPGLEKPQGTIAAGGQKHALVSALLTKFRTGSVGSSLNDPIHTITAGGAPARPSTGNVMGLVTASLVHLGHGESSASGAKRWSYGIRPVDSPLNTITASGVASALVTAALIKMRGTNIGQPALEPLRTISAQGTHHAEVRCLLEAFEPPLEGPQLVQHDGVGTVMIRGEIYRIDDIFLRMLSPSELFRAQGFPSDYKIAIGVAGKPLTKAAQVRMCGNSVSPINAAVIVRANYAHRRHLEIAA